MASESARGSDRTLGREAGLMLEAAGRFFGECHVSVPDAPPGYSGSSFVLVESSGGRWLLRRWPTGFDAGKIAFVHGALVESRVRGFEGVPKLAITDDGQTNLQLAGRLYDAQEYLPGRPLAGRCPASGPVPNVAARLPCGRLGTLAEAVARFHRSTLHLPVQADREVAGLPVRLGGLAAEMGLCFEALLDGARTRAVGKERETALRWLEVLPQALTVAREVSEKRPIGRGARVLCHGDLWPAHVYFDGDDFVGFADFESLVFAPAALDLAQLIGHFGGWATREVVLEAYEKLTPPGERCRSTLQRESSLELVADLVDEGLWSLRALYIQPSSDTNSVQREAHAFNLGALLGCLEDVMPELQEPLG